METKTIYLKNNVDFKRGQIYSLCLRRARYFEPDESILFCTPSKEHGTEMKITSQHQFRFFDLKDGDVRHNYDANIQSIIDLQLKMMQSYKDFDDREIVTIIKFKML